MPTQSQRSSREMQLDEIEALTICTKKTHTENHSKPCMMAPGALLSPLPSSLLGDYIGMESCFDFANSEPPCDCGSDCIREKREQRCRMTRTKKTEMPPPIPRRMPWVLKRYYTSDGRLILREEKVGSNEYFRAHRSNGRFILDLVPFDDHNNEFDDYVHGDKEAEASSDDRVAATDNETYNINNDHDHGHKDEDDEDGDSNNNLVEALHEEKEFTVVEDSKLKCPIAETPLENGGKCLKYNTSRASPACFLGLPVPAIRQVHS
ncbi:hypothetical protein V6N13_065542 [Hibiscus sabdariffa]|uniref:FAF domain-containing protein n=1 Tax=Hibiscus sabdariffa TaxID=183260 RepID=A0ABR2QQS1_9ROSI